MNIRKSCLRMDLPYKGHIKNKSLYNPGKAGGKTGLGAPRRAWELPRVSTLVIQGATSSFSTPLKKSRYKASLIPKDGSSPPQPGCQISLLHPGSGEGSPGGLCPPAGVCTYLEIREKGHGVSARGLGGCLEGYNGKMALMQLLQDFPC